MDGQISGQTRKKSNGKGDMCHHYNGDMWNNRIGRTVFMWHIVHPTRKVTWHVQFPGDVVVCTILVDQSCFDMWHKGANEGLPRDSFSLVYHG